MYTCMYKLSSIYIICRYASRIVHDPHKLSLNCFHRECPGISEENDIVWMSLLPSGHIVNTVLQYVWALWEDPVDVSCYSHDCDL